MITIVENFLIEFGLNKPDKTFLVGFSGGYDSICLLDILNVLSQKYGYKLVALHLNHNWRAEESARDEDNCRQFCQNNSIEYFSKTLSEDIPQNETFAREARYDFFAEESKKYSNPVVFTAHTRTDNAETIVYRMIKGTGLKGIQGILPFSVKNSIPLYRPLLNVSRDKIEMYCASKGLVANNDSSNYDVSYKRNFIRHKIMPLFKDINFHSEKALVSLANLAINQNKIVEEYLKIILNDLFDGEKVLTQKFKTLSKEVQLKIIYEGCLKYNLDYDYKKIVNIRDFINENIDSKAGSSYSLTSNLWLFASSKYIYLLDQIQSEFNTTVVPIDKEGEYKFDDTDYIFSIKKFDSDKPVIFPSENSKFAYVCLDDFSNLEIRTRRTGDFITPFGMNGSMKMKKYLNAKGVFKHQRDELIMLCRKSEVLWVVGVGLSNKLKVVNKPTHVLELINKV